MTRRKVVNKPCPNESAHTPHPTGYIVHAYWAEEMSKTHHQIKCAGCGLWAIWVPNSEVSEDESRRDVTG